MAEGAWEAYLAEGARISWDALSQNERQPVELLNNSVGTGDGDAPIKRPSGACLEDLYSPLIGLPLRSRRTIFYKPDTNY